ncbi:MAG: EAL domain-containing protein [Proteobacteria bacterium]|nr:EAL domain-containing protein [Pseudomonadota bacterium]
MRKPVSVAEDAETRVRRERDLREVCAARGFDIAYQPQVDLRTERVRTFEALIRWHHPDRGNVSPAEFIPLAEEIGLIGEIGQWVLERACREAMHWPKEVRLAVNVSPLQIADIAFPAVVGAALAAAGLSPSRLELEVTETRVMPDDPVTQAVLRAIGESGVGIVLDDFDIGYSTLGYLLNFPISKIKIDRTFIDKIPQDEHRHEAAITIVRSLIGLCKDLRIICLAEGVETEEQLATLMQANCTEIQGYLFGRPQPLAETLASLRNIPDLLRRMKVSSGNSMGAAQQPQSQAIPFLQIAETANDIILVTTPDLDPPGPLITYVNPAFTRLTGYTVAEAIGRSPRILQGPGTNRATLDNILASLRSGRPAHQKILNFGKSGAPYWLDMHIVPLRDAQGTITHFAAIERDVTLDKRRLDELEYLADRDTLTGIPNRRAFLRAMKSVCDAADARGHPASKLKGPCLAFIDIDHFKRINDERGHAVGDAVLCGMADCLAENVRRVDILGRLGGEEFAVCMPAVALQDAKALAQRLRCAVAGAAFDTPGGPVNITVSLGVACYSPGDTVATLLERADAAMYVAKRNGRNCVRVEASKSDDRVLTV